MNIWPIRVWSGFEIMDKVNTPQQGLAVHDVLGSMASGNPEEFTIYFRRMRQMFPSEMAEACLWCIASRGLDTAARAMAFWLGLDGKYIGVLFDPDSLPVETASKAAAAMKVVDPDFFRRFLKACEQLTSVAQILRSLSLLPALGDYGHVLPWLRQLCNHDDPKIRSRAVKQLCELRPNKALIERQMLSSDPRVRANAIEVLWHTRTPDATAIFKAAASDPHHRVVGNALVGLYFQGDDSAFTRMTELSSHSNELFRAAMAWCFGWIKDQRAVSFLQVLSQDRSAIVGKRALQSLLVLREQQIAETEATTVTEKTIAPIEPEPVAESTLTTTPEPEQKKSAPLPKFALLK